MQTNNVLIFPKPKQPSNNVKQTTAIATRKDVDEKLEQTIQYHIQKSISFIVPALFNSLHMAGFTPDGDDDFTIKEGAFIVESIRSYMFAFHGLKHPFQKIVDKVFVQEEDDGKDMLTIAQNITVTLGE